MTKHNLDAIWKCSQQKCLAAMKITQVHNYLLAGLCQRQGKHDPMLQHGTIMCDVGAACDA